MLILVSNDDGVQSPGIRILADVLRCMGDVYIIAPDGERSAQCHALTPQKPLRLENYGGNIYSGNGTPTDCINLGVNGLLHRKPDLIVSGINRGGNLGDDVTYSGTVSAPFEGTLLGIPSFAISQVADANYKFDAATRFAVRMDKHVIKHGLPKDTLLNVNVPNLDTSSIKGIRITH